MIRVTVILHDKRKGEIEVDPHASLKDVRKAIVTDLDLEGVPEDYLLAVADKAQVASCGNVQLTDGDFMFLIQASDTKPAPVQKINKESFK